MKVVHYCIKIIVKLVRPKFDIHSYVFLGRARRVRSPASSAQRIARAAQLDGELKSLKNDIYECQILI